MAFVPYFAINNARGRDFLVEQESTGNDLERVGLLSFTDDRFWMVETSRMT